MSPHGERGRSAALNGVRTLALAALLAAGCGAASVLFPAGLPWAPTSVSAFTAQAEQPVGGSEAAAEHSGASPEGEPLWKTGARILNFAILAGVLVYFLRSPFKAFLDARSAQIRSELVNAARMGQEAAERIAGVERRMRALPADLEALREKGHGDIAAEQKRIREVAEAERRRLHEQARGQIDLRLRIAERELTSHAADRLVAIAAERIRKTINEQDQLRLVERYLSQVSVARRRSGLAARPDGESEVRP